MVKNYQNISLWLLELYKDGMKYEGYVEHLNKKIEKETNFFEEKRVEKNIPL